jgi:NAD+ synthase (glutamine-hydrolysing)
MKYGFIKVAAAVPAVKVADVVYNVQEIEKLISLADSEHVEIVCFPELCITGYTCQDLFKEQLLLTKAEEGLLMLLDFTRKLDVIAIVGLPVQARGLLLNCAVVIQHGTILGVVPKTYLPNYNEFYEKRWFASAQDLNPTDIYLAGTPVHLSSEPLLFQTCDGVRFGVEICEDVWAPIPPSNNLTMAGAEIIFNCSASDELIGKHGYLRSLVAQQSARTMSGYVYASSGFGESTQDVVYAGNAMIFENGKVLVEGERFSFQPQLQSAQIDAERLRTDRQTNSTFINAQREAHAQIIEAKPAMDDHPFEFTRSIDAHPFIPQDHEMADTCEEILNIQTAGLAKRLIHTNCQHVVIGISGGLDSTLALLVCVRTFDRLGYDRKGIIGVTMPGFGTTDRTYHNAVALMNELGITVREISIREACLLHFNDIGHDPQNHDVTYENAQARERTQILMDVANQVGGFVVGTGDLSELALGWCTYNADHMSNYGVNCSIPKTLVRHLVRWSAMHIFDDKTREVLLDVVDTPISPELTPADAEGNIQQKTEDLVGPYELHDFFLYHFIRHASPKEELYALACHAFKGVYTEEKIASTLQVFLRRFFTQQFKRNVMTDGPQVTDISLSPRGAWQMPSDTAFTPWK